MCMYFKNTLSIKKKILVLFSLIILACSIPALPVSARAQEVESAGAPGVSAASAVLISGDDGTVIFEKNAQEPRAMASTTKIMTALLTLEEAARSGDPTLTVTEEMVRVEGSSMGLLPGNKLSLTNLAAGMLLASGNDAANSAALFISGDQESFAELMNARAGEIGMEHTNFVTPSGLDDDQHYSTAYDMALLAKEALKNPDFAKIAGSSSLQVEFLEPPGKVTYSNHNKLLRIYDGCIGVKTGFTKKAGRCLVSAARRDGTTLIAVTLDAPDDWDDHAALLDYGFATVKTVTMGDIEQSALPVVGGLSQQVELSLCEPVSMTLPIEEAEQISVRVVLPKFLYAPVQAGEQVGQVQYLSRGEELFSVPILTAGQSLSPPVQEKTFFEKLINNIKNLFR